MKIIRHLLNATNCKASNISILLCMPSFGIKGFDNLPSFDRSAFLTYYYTCYCCHCYFWDPSSIHSANTAFRIYSKKQKTVCMLIKNSIINLDYYWLRHRSAYDAGYWWAGLAYSVCRLNKSLINKQRRKVAHKNRHLSTLLPLYTS